MTKVKDKERILKAAREKQNQLQGNLLRLSANFSTEMGFTGGSGGKASACSAGDPCLIPGSGRSPGEEIGYPFQYLWASLVDQTVKNLPAMRETWVRFPGLGRSPGGGYGNPLQYACLENPHGQRSLAGCMQSMGS